MKYKLFSTEKNFSEPMHHGLDEALVEWVEENGEPVIRFWKRDEPAIPIGRFQSYEDEVAADYVKEKGWDVVRRITGGGAMFVQPGKVITYSLYVPREEVTDDFVKSYEELDSFVVKGLNKLGIDAYHEPINDIVCKEGKIGGSAQLRRGTVVLHHATLNYGIDVKEMLKCLRIGKEKISDKAIKSAEKRVTGISEKVDLSVEEVSEALLESFSEDNEVEDFEFGSSVFKRAEELSVEKFGSSSWNKKL